MASDRLKSGKQKGKRMHACVVRRDEHPTPPGRARKHPGEGNSDEESSDDERDGDEAAVQVRRAQRRALEHANTLSCYMAESSLKSSAGATAAADAAADAAAAGQHGRRDGVRQARAR
jgi:hypothetical protein